MLVWSSQTGFLTPVRSDTRDLNHDDMAKLCVNGVGMLVDNKPIFPV